MSGETAWSSYNTPRIWAMVANEDNPESWRQVAALGSMAGLLKDQRSRLETAKQKLIDAWPPEKNKAAAAFVETIDELMLNMQENKRIADTNAAALGQVLEALRQAKADIAPIYASYLDKSDDLVPAWWDGAEDELDEKARQRMRAAEQVIADPGNTIKVPPAYELSPVYVRTKIEDDPRPATGPQSGGRADSGAAGASGSANSFVVPHEPPPPVPGRDDAQPPGPPRVVPVPSGPELAGVVTPPAPPGNPFPSVPPPVGPGAVGSPGLVIGGAMPLRPPATGAGGFRGGTTPLGVTPRGNPPRGGTIGRGSLPAVKPATPSWLPPPAGQPARGGASPGRGAVGSPATSLPGGRRPAAKRDEDGNLMFDPDNPWATDEGVEPVIAPSQRAYRHDAGPGVIGWHG